MLFVLNVKLLFRWLQEVRIKRLISEHTSQLLQQLMAMKTETMQKIDAIQSDTNRSATIEC